MKLQDRQSYRELRETILKVLRSLKRFFSFPTLPHELADLRIPEYRSGDLLCHPKGRTLIVVSAHVVHGDWVEYTVLCPEGTYDRLHASALANWTLVTKP